MRTFYISSRGQPTATLLPYTTLFRSQRGGLGRADPDRKPVRPRLILQEDVVAGRLPIGVGRPAQVGNVHRHKRRGQDRKSTRVNSSHSSISCAVFCVDVEALVDVARA